ncbi:restriction endonuclease subunit S [Pelagicoccus albus]|uniref:Restriction endonuclease subunit S n=1 Tax=Pelagicoccus albus TaxID=415222 RepID=A0A7X1E7U3_9BACT|nr:restriction endonuclease subunit S [Pelagicoccus albus]MBC2605629.1 restriction endonuclease subunit S [Pelagicoccus albus]
MSWTISSLSEAADIVAGQHIPSDLYSDDESGTPYLTGPVDFGMRVPSVTKWTSAPKVFAEKGDVLVTVKGSGVGKSNLGIDAAIGRQLMAIRPRLTKIDQFYLYTFIKSVEPRIHKLAQGAAIPGIVKADLADLQIPLPPLAEQKRIAGILDAADGLRAKRRAALAQLDTLLQSTFLDLFGDPNRWSSKFKISRLVDCCTKITDGEHGTVERLESGRLYLMARNVTKQKSIDLSDVSYISEEDHRRIYKRCGPEAGDLLLVCVGATIGKVALVPEGEEFSLARSVALIKPNRDRMLPSFLLHLFDSGYIQFKLLGQRNTGAQSGLYLGKIKELEIPLPPLDLQRRFASIVESVERQKARHREHLAQLDTLFASLQQRAFKGDL